MTEPTACIFLSGAEMDPTAVLAAYPGARFVARARMSADQHEVAPAFGESLANDASAEVWGILIEHASGAEKTRRAITDDGREIEAVIGDEPFAHGEPEAVLAAARYWELPPAYVGRLRAAVAAGNDED